jgi:replicative DNA helicase
MGTGNWEAIAIAKLVVDYDKELLVELSPSYFSGVYSPIFKIVLQHFSDNQKLPTMEILEAAVAAKAPKAQLPVVNGVLTAIKNINVRDIDRQEVTKGLKDKLLLQTMDNQLASLTHAAMSKDTEGVRTILNEVVEDINLTRTKPIDFYEAMEAPDTSKIVTTGLDGLDPHLIGMAGLTIVSASSGAGKSAFLLQSAVGQFKAGHSVLFISLELSAQVLGYRLKSMLTDIPFGKIVANDLTPQESKLIAATMEEFFSDPDKHFRIVTSQLDTDELLTLINVEKALYDIDIVHLDYLGLVASPRGSEGGWRNLSDTAKALHRLSMEIGVVTVSATQVTIDKQPKGGGYPEITTRGSSELLFSATLLIFLHRPEGTDGIGEEQSVVLYVLKNRNSKQCQLLLNADFSHMRFEFMTEL